MLSFKRLRGQRSQEKNTKIPQLYFFGQIIHAYIYILDVAPLPETVANEGL